MLTNHSTFRLKEEQEERGSCQPMPIYRSKKYKFLDKKYM